MNISKQTGAFLVENEFLYVVKPLAQPAILAYTEFNLLILQPIKRQR
jgi:hypothetical protein